MESRSTTFRSNISALLVVPSLVQTKTDFNKLFLITLPIFNKNITSKLKANSFSLLKFMSNPKKNVHSSLPLNTLIPDPDVRATAKQSSRICIQI